jgi:glycosyltransferase involved in cell wall biosynthesis
MKLLLVVANFVPEIGSAAHIYFDLSKAFVNRGHEVHVITSYPREFNLEENDKNKNFPLDEIIDGVHVHRCRHPAQRDNIVLRGFEHFVLPRYYFKIYKNLGIKFDACLLYIPPLPLYYLARKIKKYDGTKSILNFQDFHPQELTDVGVLRNPLMIKILEHIEKKAYRTADFITVLSHGGIEYIVKRGGDPNKIKHIYNGVILEDIRNYKKKKDFKIKARIEDKFLVSYAGILSPYQGIDNILDSAKQLIKHDDIVFYIVGDGSVKQHLQERISNEDISNVRLLPFQSRDEYFNIINSSDISFVSLDERMKAPCLPGKIKDLLGLGQPIIASVAFDSETAYVVKTAGGIVVESGDPVGLSETILKISYDPTIRRDIGTKGKIFHQENMNLNRNIEQYIKIFYNMINKDSIVV